jgi:hypothetical protein
MHKIIVKNIFIVKPENNKFKMKTMKAIQITLNIAVLYSITPNILLLKV